MCIENCGYWCPGAEAPGHQYPQCSLNTHCIGLILSRNVTFIVNSRTFLVSLKTFPWTWQHWKLQFENWTVPMNLSKFINSDILKTAFSWKRCFVFWFNFPIPRSINTFRLIQNGHQFLNVLHLMKICAFWLKFYWKLFPMVTGSDNGLSLNRWQAIIWPNDGLVWCPNMSHPASMS